MGELAVARIAAPDATVHVPGSKSLTNRAFVCAALAEGPSRLIGWLESDDTAAMTDGLARLGVRVERAGADVVVHGTGGNFAIPLHPIDCRASGTTMRFLTACAALVQGRVVLDGVPRMRERPIQDLADALAALGVQVRTVAGCPPVTVQGGRLTGGRVAVEASKSSQFLSALLMVAPLAQGEVEITASQITSRPYVDLTLETMSSFGISVDARGETFRIPGGQSYRARAYLVEPDASAATYFFAAAAVTGGRVRVEGISAASLQPDVRFVEVLERMGCTVERGPRWIAVRGPRYLHGVDVDLNALPDSALTLAVVALFARGRTAIRNVPNLRLKETDRMAALETELRKLGARVQTSANDLVIEPPAQLTPASIATYDDHRMAMSFAVAGLAVDGITIQNPECVAKTFPGFFDELRRLSA
ncbi:MAG TPA: 3-phosphoshikimate 1-carboxyvinyltransferase [Myxococcota bacterium]|nr:3-phosphoshikimate 1-carboxyvinyltransferase [Myxococcota bacterium]